MKPLEKARLPEDGEWSPIDIVREIHRGDRGYVGFAKMRSSGDRVNRVEHLFSVRLDEMVRGKRAGRLRHLLKNNGLFTIQAFWRHDDSRTKHLHLGPVCRRQSDLKYLNALFVDLDFDDLGLRWRKVRRRLSRLVRNGRLPKPSILVDSGSGMWALWLLHDQKNPGLPPQGDPNPNKFGFNFRLWQRIQEKLVNRLRHLGGDLVAKDGARFMRFPGSVNTKANREVRFAVLYSKSGQRISYSLEEVAKLLGVPLSEPRPLRNTGKAVLPLVSQQKRRARLALYELRLKQLRDLEKHRGGFRQGTRENALLLLATWMKVLGRLSKKEVIAWGARCDPPLDRATCLRRIRAAKPKMPMRDVTIADWLRITPQEKCALKLSWPSAGGSAEKTVASGPKKTQTRIKKRRKLCRKFLRNHGGVTSRKLVKLYAKRGIEVSLATAARDLSSVQSSASHGAAV